MDQDKSEPNFGLREAIADKAWELRKLGYVEAEWAILELLKELIEKGLI